MKDNFELELLCPIICLIGAVVSLTSCFIVFKFTRKLKATHISDPSIIYNFLCVGILDAFCLIGLGIFTLFIYFDYAGEAVDIILEIFANTCSIAFILEQLFALLMTYDAYNSFKSPLISQANYKYKILGMYAIAALAIGLYYSFNAFTFASTAQYCFLLTSSAIFLLILLILVYKMRNQLRYYRKHGKTNILFKQILRIQHSFCAIFFIIETWRFTYTMVLSESTIGKCINAGFISFQTFVLLLPFLYNIYTVLFVYPKEFRQACLKQLSLYQIREELLLYVLKGINGEVIKGRNSKEYQCQPKKEKNRKFTKMRSLLKYDSFDIEMAAPIANVLKVEEEYSFLDLEEHQEDLIFGKKNHRGTQGLEIQFVELSPEIFLNIRRAFNIEDKDVIEALSIRKYREGKISIHIRDDSFFIASKTSIFSINSITKEEYDVLKHNLETYSYHMMSHSKTVLYPVFGAYGILFPRKMNINSLYFIISRQISTINMKTKHKREIKFEISPMFENGFHQSKKGPNLNWTKMTEKEIETSLKMGTKHLATISNLDIGLEKFSQIMPFLKADIDLLQECFMMAYSLMFITNLTKCCIVAGESVKDFFCTKEDFINFELKNKLFIYAHDDIIICKEIHATYLIEYHICNKKDLDRIKNADILDKTQKNGFFAEDLHKLFKLNQKNEEEDDANRSTTSSRKNSKNSRMSKKNHKTSKTSKSSRSSKISSFLSNLSLIEEESEYSEEENDFENIILNFKNSYHLFRDKNEFIGEEDEDETTPWIYIAPLELSCQHCLPTHEAPNHLFYCHYNQNKKHSDRDGIKPFSQLIILPNHNTPSLWKATFQYSIINYMRPLKKECPIKYSGKFVSTLINTLLSE